MEQGIAHSTFTCFGSLPSEIKDRIWEIAEKQRIQDMQPQAHICEVFEFPTAMANSGHLFSMFQGAASETGGNHLAEPFHASKYFNNHFSGARVSLSGGESAYMLPNFRVENGERKNASMIINAVRPSQDLFIVRFQGLCQSSRPVMLPVLRMGALTAGLLGQDAILRKAIPRNIGIEITPCFRHHHSWEPDQLIPNQNLLKQIEFLFSANADPPKLWLLLSSPGANSDYADEFEELLASLRPRFTGQGRQYVELSDADVSQHPLASCFGQYMRSVLKHFKDLDVPVRNLVPSIGYMNTSQSAIPVPYFWIRSTWCFCVSIYPLSGQF